MFKSWEEVAWNISFLFLLAEQPSDIILVHSNTSVSRHGSMGFAEAMKEKRADQPSCPNCKKI
jgi:hypothetical protein